MEMEMEEDWQGGAVIDNAGMEITAVHGGPMACSSGYLIGWRNGTSWFCMCSLAGSYSEDDFCCILVHRPCILAVPSRLSAASSAKE